MKLYIMISNDLGGMNGVVLYLRNKLKYMQDHGWKAILLNCHDDANSLPIYIDELKEWNDKKEYKFSFLRNYPACYNKKRLKQNIESVIRVLAITDNLEECIIESNSYLPATWAELIAKRINGKHIFLSSTEKPYINNAEFYKFLRFKLERNELRGINEQSMKKWFSAYYDIPDSERYRMPIFCDTLIEYYPSSWNSCVSENVDYHICTIGRLDKSYIIPMIQGIGKFCRFYSKKVQLIIFGGAYTPGVAECVEQIAEKTPGLSYVCTGMIYPIPKKVYDQMDVAIGTAGAARVLENYGLPTITMESECGNPIGLLGITTNNTIYLEECDEIHALEEWLYQVLIEKRVVKRLDKQHISTYEEEMNLHYEWIQSLSGTREYYDTSKIINLGTHKTRLRLVLYRIWGIECVNKILKSSL